MTRGTGWPRRRLSSPGAAAGGARAVAIDGSRAARAIGLAGAVASSDPARRPRRPRSPPTAPVRRRARLHRGRFVAPRPSPGRSSATPSSSEPLGGGEGPGPRVGGRDLAHALQLRDRRPVARPAGCGGTSPAPPAPTWPTGRPPARGPPAGGAGGGLARHRPRPGRRLRGHLPVRSRRRPPPRAPGPGSSTGPRATWSTGRRRTRWPRRWPRRRPTG